MSTNKLYDVVYIVKEDPNNEELRYSIRSVEENFPVRYIWIFGYCPRWLSNIIYVPVKQDGDKWSNSKKLFETIANASFLPDQFVLFNDDFFVMEKIDTPEHHYDGLLIDRINYLEDKFKNTFPLYANQLRQVYDRYLHPAVLNLEDSRMWDALGNGTVMDVFQFSTGVGLATAKQIKPRDPVQLTSANALMRLMGEKGKERPMDRYCRLKNDMQ